MMELKIAIAHLAVAKEIASSFLAVRDFNKFVPKINELLGQIVDANETMISIQKRESSLTAKIDELEKEVMRLKNWEQEKEKYEEREIAYGVSAYIVKNYTGSFESAHKFCSHCFHQTIPARLQQSKKPGHNRILFCPNGCPPIEFNRYIK